MLTSNSIAKCCFYRNCNDKKRDVIYCRYPSAVLIAQCLMGLEKWRKQINQITYMYHKKFKRQEANHVQTYGRRLEFRTTEINSSHGRNWMRRFSLFQVQCLNVMAMISKPTKCFSFFTGVGKHVKQSVLQESLKFGVSLLENHLLSKESLICSLQE